MNGRGGFILRGNQGYLKLELEELFGFHDSTSIFGGYDANGIVEIKSSGFGASGELWFTTGEVYLFYQQLKKSFEDLSGEASFSSTEHNLEFKCTFTWQGHIMCTGFYKEYPAQENELRFEFLSDQSFIPSTLKDLKEFVQMYGGPTGIK